MRHSTCALLLIVCVGSSVSLCQLFRNEAYRPSAALLGCSSTAVNCYPPLVRNLLP